ncbi:cell filamentation protein Fic [Salmonella enterica subsp. diarizonae]|uniref:protein adenylyltransferase n=1 Tax=Salmonella diarizonae TaxID=59204 RepID=A0A379XXM2_SALDZ|nr:KfrB domain-containing protein [Salmonella enterica]ECH9341638.1 cell filamentation protein Fic [Salmonella enterica subsp. diarizonae]EDU9903158.1 cell filamentation protein Fic [Salmonella enterica subsp. diarizonae]KAA8683497.1 cell filamentation protein Fic [Salmonella enterica subsp. diarizonae]SUI37579.1 cell filamentation protein Fic [Salmonella enterica subsp. diarizonae]VFS63724.1 cell filamentation protein Fic [Salmonella enterica subsp. diarizonae]
MSDNKDPYFYPGTDVLINTADIRDKKQLEAFERDTVALNLSQLEESPILGPFDEQRLKETHKRIFTGIYPWAGEFRENTGMMVKERLGNQVVYADSAYIEPELSKLFQMLEKEQFFHRMAPEKMAERLGHYYSEFDALHPFREGNSRTLRQFMSDLALNAGMNLNWSMVATDDDARLKLYLARDVAVINADSSMLTDIIKKAVSPVPPTQTIDDNTRSNTDMSKQRVLVMNGQRVLQSGDAGKWKNDNVDKAGSIKPGIYPLYLSREPDKTNSYNGPILHADKQSVYQQVGKQIFKHDRQYFDKLPEIGTEKSISYDQTSGKAQVAAATEKQGRKFSR